LGGVEVAVDALGECAGARFAPVATVPELPAALVVVAVGRVTDQDEALRQHHRLPGAAMEVDPTTLRPDRDLHHLLPPRTTSPMPAPSPPQPVQIAFRPHARHSHDGLGAYVRTGASVS